MIEIDTIVVGGGPAGAATAAGLAACGREIVLIERSTAAHHKVCGEFLSPETQALLAQLGVDARGLGAVPVTQLVVASARHCAETQITPHALSLSRYRLDEALLACADGKGVTIRRGVSVRSARRSGSGWMVHHSGGDAPLRCRNLVISTGKVPLRGFDDGRDTSCVGLKIHLDVPAHLHDAISGKTLLAFVEKGYVGLQPIEDDGVNVCCLLPQPLVRRIGRSWSALRAYLSRAAPSVAELLAGDPRWEKPLAAVCPNTGYVYRETGADVFRVGDRLAHIPPLAGDGLAIALATARLASGSIAENRSAAEYQREAQELVGRAVSTAALASRFARSKGGRVLFIEAARLAPSILDLVLQGTRIPLPAD